MRKDVVSSALFQRGDQIAYIPAHADGDINHPDVEFGFVTGGPNAMECFFCRYWSKETPYELRTKANSEMTPSYMMRYFQSVPDKLVVKALKEYCS